VRSAPPPPPPLSRKPPARRPENKPAFKLAVWVAGVLLVAVVGAAAYYAYQTFFPVPAPAPVTRPKATPAPVAAAPDQPASPAASLPGKMVEKARAAAAARGQINEEQLGPVLEAETEKSPAPVPNATPPSMTPVTPPTASPTAAEPVTPSETFKQWVAQARVSGVRGGPDARAHINDRLVRKGEIVDHGLGITFEGVEPGQNVLLFKDRDGAVVGKRF
jgi:hypothetical protein